MKRFAIAIVGGLTALLLMGMGDLGGGPAESIPETTENVAAQVTDRSGATADLTRFSMDGKVFLAGKYGDGEVTVQFKELRAVDFGQVAGEYIPVQLRLASGESLELKVRKRATFYGSTGFGAYQIRARDIKHIEFAEKN